MKKTGKIKNCLFCKQEFYAPLWLEKRDGAKYCSKVCYWENKHDEPWNKNTKGLIKSNRGSFSHTESKWTGDIKEYKSLHYWVGKNLGKPEVCSSCGEIKEGKNIHWANKSGEYKKDPNDWIRLCVRCHYKFDNVERRRAIWLN